VPVDLWSPFELSVVFGALGPQTVSNWSWTCLSLRPPGAPIEVAALCASFVSGGSALRIDALGDSVPIGSVEFPDATAVELRIEADASEIRLHGRGIEDASATLIAAMPFSQTGPIRVEVGVESAAPNELVFDLARFATSRSPAPTAEEAIADDVAQALSAGLDAYFLLDGGAPDFVAARAKLTEAQAALQNARSRGARGRAARWIDQARRKLAKAIVQSERGSAARALDALQKSGEKQIRALDALVPNNP
jgi:hypothetical protein